MTSTRVGQTTFSDEISPTAWRTATTRTYYQNDLLNAEYHMKVYQGGNLVLPGRVALSGVYLDLRGNLTGVDHLVVGNKSTVDFELTSTTNLREPPAAWEVEEPLGDPNVFAFASLVVEDNSRVRLREGSRLIADSMTVGSRSFEHPVKGTTRRRMSGLVDVAVIRRVARRAVGGQQYVRRNVGECAGSCGG